jgi:hypothetical protein
MARQHRDNLSFTRVNTCKLFYMDVGVWGGGPGGKAKTTFGLVCGNDVLLCSWLNLVEEGRAPSTGQDPSSDYKQLVPEGEFALSAGAQEFLEVPVSFTAVLSCTTPAPTNPSPTPASP